MDGFKDIFDTYGRQARLQPALFVFFPIIFMTATWAPTLYNLATALVGLAISFGIVTFLANWARAKGREVEGRLYQSWGGKPTTIWLRHNDSHLDEITKNRYHTFLSVHIRNWTAPSVDDEIQNPTIANARYDSAVKWLLEYTRDKKRFPLVFTELVAYGFRRNLYGMKTAGVTVTVTCLLADIGFVAFFPQKTTFFAVLSVCLLFLAAWLVVIRPKWVKDAADGYARALLSSCESAIP
jgi:NADH:ubiquinone oxidoreductase subunit K